MSGPTVMMTLGDFKFGIATAAYQELTRITEWRWPAQERFMQGQALQYVGPGGDTIALPGVVYPEYRGGGKQMDKIRALGGKGQPLPLVSGTGDVLGRWVVERLEDKGSVFGADGLPRKQEFTINLRKFDEPTADSGNVITAATAGKLPIGPIPMLQNLTSSGASGIAGIASSISSSVAAVQSYASTIGSTVNSVLQPLNRAMGVATNLQASISSAKRLLGSVPSSLSGKNSASALLSGANDAVMNASAAGAALKRSVDSLTGLATSAPQAFQAVQTAMTNVNQLTVAATSIQQQASTALNGFGGV